LRLIEGIRGRIEGLLTAPGRELGSWARFLRFQVHLWRFCARRLREHNVSAMSAALCFRTIFAMIPAIVLGVLVIKSTGVLQDSKELLRRVLAGSGIDQIAITESVAETADGLVPPPPKVINVAEKIEAIVDDVEAKLTLGRVGPIGAALLIWTALTLLTTVERSLNRIFGAECARPMGRRLIVYWSALTLGPLVWVVASMAGGRMVEAAQHLPGVAWLIALTGRAGPIVVGIMVVAAVYRLMPHTAVRLRAAVGGAVVAVPLWLLAKWGFSSYVTRFVGSNLYGALGLLPLFLIWLNVSWLIFLFGAELAHTVANLGSMHILARVQNGTAKASDLLAAAIAVGESFMAERGAIELGEVARRLRLPPDMALGLLDTLAARRILCSVDDRQDRAYVLARSPERISVLEIVGLEWPDTTVPREREYEPEISRRVDSVREQAQRAIGTYTLADAVGPVGWEPCAKPPSRDRIAVGATRSHSEPSNKEDHSNLNGGPSPSNAD